ncbi:MAG: FG-GAP-like repeat-containing protein [Gemmatimonadota bacterium]
MRAAATSLGALTVWVAAACAGGSAGPVRTAVSGASRTGTVAAGDWIRRVAPFSVTGPDGTAYAEPFLGGFNVPRPQLVDIDGDGDDDLMLQETTGGVMLFERVDGAGASYRWRTDRFQDLDVGEWYRFVDFDGDGDVDLLAEEPFSYIRYYRNEGGATDPRFELVTDTLRDVDGEPLFADRQSIPNASDLDCDGAIDLLVGRLTGTVTHYEAEGTGPDGIPRFRRLTDRFEDIEIVAQFGSAHGANTMALGDVDEDGDDDLFWGDFFEAGVLLIENGGDCDAPSFRSEPTPFPTSEPLKTSGYNAPTLGDPDGDGDPDLLVGVLGGAFNPNTTLVENLHWLEQGAAGEFTDRTSRFIGTVDVGSESVPVLVDLDGDGDLDLLVGNRIEPDDPQNGALHRFVNRGGATSPSLAWDGRLDGLGAGYHRIPAFGDLDGDGDADAIVGTWLDRLSFYRNGGTDGSVRLELVDSASATLTRGRNAAPALGDLDGDGDLDLVVGESSGQLGYYRNDGGPSAPRFTLQDDGWLDVDVGRRSFPVLEDLDGDGDLDLLVGSENEGIRVFLNEGTPSDPELRDAGVLAVDTFGFATPAFGDLDGDGDRDLVLGGGAGGLRYFERR